jgi:energy-coupling factor transporter ATP-binding protein EcfA2
MKIITATERGTAPRGAKLLIVGPTGVGKTSLVRTLNTSTTLLVDVEAGDLSIADVAVDTIRPRTWQEIRDLAVALAGANPAVPDGTVYSQEHYEAVAGTFGDLKKYDSIFFDSVTAISRLSFAWSCQQPAAFSERTGKPDRRGAYGVLANEMIAWALHLQQMRQLNIVLVGVLETVTDEFNIREHRLQMEGARTTRELPAILDEIICMNWVDFGDGVPTRAFICQAPNKWGYPAKSRSGKLSQFEPPDLGQLLLKLSTKTSDGDFVASEAVQSQVKAKAR